jgi:hypothetical protein
MTYQNPVTIDSYARKQLSGPENGSDFPRIQTLPELMDLLPDNCHSQWKNELHNSWCFYEHLSLKYSDRHKHALPDLPRSLTDNELKVLPRLTTTLLQGVRDKGLWFFDDCVNNIYMPYNGWDECKIWRTCARSWTNGQPINSTYTLRKRSKYLFFETAGTGFHYRTEYPQGIAEILSREFHKCAIKNVTTIIRDKFIRLWCSVPHKKGTHIKTIAKKLFDYLPTDQKPSKDKQDQFIEALLEHIDLLKTSDKERRANFTTERRKQIQQNARWNSQQMEWTVIRAEQYQQRDFNRETMKLDRLQMKLEKQQQKLQDINTKNLTKLHKYQCKLDQTLHMRSATLLSGVCKSLNQHYKTINNKEISTNPFDTPSSDTFIIAQHLLTTSKIA